MTKTVELKKPPSPNGNFIGNLLLLRKNALKVLMEYSENFNPVVKIRIGTRPIYFITRPDQVKHIFLDNFRNYNKNTRGWNKVKIILRNGVFVTSGNQWQRQRRTMQPAFHHDRNVVYTKIMENEAEALSHRWEKIFQEGRGVNIHSEMMGITLRVIAKTMFSEDIGNHIDDVWKSMTTVLNYIEKSYLKFFDWPLSIPTAENKRLKNAVKVLDDMVFEFIEKKRKNGLENNDLLSTLMKASDPETGKTMDDFEVRDQVMTILLAGHETTANSLTFAWCLLAQNPSVENKLVSELNRVLGGRSPKFDDLKNLNYTENIFKEALRLYPPPWVISRHAIKEDVLAGYKIPAGSTVFVSPYCLHRLSEFWKNPNEFYPDRFGEGAEPSHPYAYIPFGTGPRMCMGKDFAMAEAVIIVATLAQRFKLKLETSGELELDTTVTLRPKDKIIMKIERR